MTFASTPAAASSRPSSVAFGLGLAAALADGATDLAVGERSPPSLAGRERPATGTQAEIARLQAVARRAPAATEPRVSSPPPTCSASARPATRASTAAPTRCCAA